MVVVNVAVMPDVDFDKYVVGFGAASVKWSTGRC